MEQEEAYLWRYGDISKKIFNVKKEEAHLWMPNGQCPLTSCVTFDVKDIAKKMLRSRYISTKKLFNRKRWSSPAEMFRYGDISNKINGKRGNV